MSVARQLELSFDTAPRDAEELLARLRALGLRDTDRLRLTRNRSVMVSYRDRVLRVHRAYLDAPRDVHAAIVRETSSAARRNARPCSSSRARARWLMSPLTATTWYRASLIRRSIARTCSGIDGFPKCRSEMCRTEITPRAR